MVARSTDDCTNDRSICRAARLIDHADPSFVHDSITETGGRSDISDSEFDFVGNKLYTLCLKNFLQFCQILTDFQNFFHCWKVYEIC